MKNCFFFWLLLFLMEIVSTQNWQPFTENETFFYQSDTSDLIDHSYNVDSVLFDGIDSVIYLNLILKDTFDTWGNTIFINNHAQFWNKEMLVLDDGNYHFKNPGNIILQTRASITDTWMFDSINSYTAIVELEDTLTIFGELDSIKNFSISSGYDIILSKNHGLIQFPSNFSNDIIIHLAGIEGRNQGVLLPRFKDYFDFNIGDVFQFKTEFTSCYIECDSYFNTEKFEVKSIIISDSMIELEREGIGLFENYHELTLQVSTIYTINDTIKICLNFAKLTNVNPSSLAKYPLKYMWKYDACSSPSQDISNLPEFYIDTTGLFSVETQYCNDVAGYNQNYGIVGENDTLTLLCCDYFCATYKEGLGLTSYYKSFGDINLDIGELIGYIKEGDTIGVITPDSLFIAPIYEPNIFELLLYPSPSTSEITVVIPNALTGQDFTIDLFNIIGKRIAVTLKNNGNNILIDLNNVADGIYFVELVSPDKTKLYRSSFVKQ